MAPPALIVAHAVTAEANDTRQLQPMGEAAREALQVDTLDILAGAGYSDGEQAAALEAQVIVPHVPANRATNNQDDGMLFDRHALHQDAKSDTFRCPAGKALVRKQLLRKDKMVIYQAREDDAATARSGRSTRAPIAGWWDATCTTRRSSRWTPVPRRRRCGGGGARWSTHLPG